MTDPPAGPDYPCLDSTILITFANSGDLRVLASLFPTAFAPSAVIREEIEPHCRRYPANVLIMKGLDEGWLHEVPVTDPGDLLLVAWLRRFRFGTKSRDLGETEVIALARHYGWIALLDDDEAKKFAEAPRKPTSIDDVAPDSGPRIPNVAMTTVIAAAAVYGHLTRKAAWDLHSRVYEARGGFAPLTNWPNDRPIFDQAIEMLAAKRTATPRSWPSFLALPDLDDVIREARRQVRGR
jgi:predicted nucleic acid-binding protein